MSATALPASCRRIRWSRVISSGISAPISRPTAIATTIIAGVYNCSQANAEYSTSTDRPPTSASTPSTSANAPTARRRRGLAASEPSPMANTITEITTEVWSTELPMR